MSGKEGRENVSGEDKRLPEMGRQEANRGFADDKGGRVMGEEGLPRMRGFPAGPHTWYSASTQVLLHRFSKSQVICCGAYYACVQCATL